MFFKADNMSTAYSKSRELLTLKELKKMNTIFFDHLAYGMQIKDKKYVIRWQNETLERELGHNIGKYCFKVTFGRNAPCKICTGHQALTAGEVTTKVDWSPINGKWYKVVAFLIYDEDSQEKLIAEIIIDITEQKRLENDFKSLKRASNIIFSLLAHDLVNHLTSVEMGLDAMKHLFSKRLPTKQLITR